MPGLHTRQMAAIRCCGGFPPDLILRREKLKGRDNEERADSPGYAIEVSSESIRRWS